MAKVKTRLFSAGSILGKRYEIKKLIGSGGMGLVYLAHDLYQEKIPVALKVLHNELINEENYVERFKKEVALMRSINHPNVVKTYDFYESEDLIFFSMEYIEGLSLADIIEQKKFDIGMIPKLLNDLCEALVLIHSLGIIHRDIKPENILLDRNGAFRITDFGVARTKLSKLTAKNIKLGSVSFISPELWRGEKPSVASDLYAVGVLLYELTTGQMPFNETKLLELMKERKRSTLFRFSPSALTCLGDS
jgi:serine/threonine protein kinase